MKVLYFSKGYTPHDFRFLSRLAETDFSVYFLCMEETLFIRENRPVPMDVTKIAWDKAGKHLGVSKIWKYTRGLGKILKNLQPDLIHAGPVQKTAFLTALSGYRPLVTMSWGYDLLLDARKGIGRWIAEYTLGKSTVFLCDSDAVAQVAHTLGVPQDRIIQFPWGVDLDHFSPGAGNEVRQALGWEKATVLLSTRTWEEIYGVDIVCKAFIEIARRNERARLLVLGDGSLRDQIESILHSSGVANRVHLAGFVDSEDLPKYYRAADLYISASHVDGSSISLLEALACGIPPVVSDIPGNQEWVIPEVNGWLFPDGSAEILAEIVLDASQDLEKLKQFSERSRKIAEERADWERNSQSLLEAYQLALSIEREQHDE